MMAVYEITFSPTGGTDKVTELLTEAMDGEKKKDKSFAGKGRLQQTCI